MTTFPLDDIEELTLCSGCKRRFDENERVPKMLSCKHHFCLECVRDMADAGGTVNCMHCWKHTEPPHAGAAALPTHAPVLALARRLAPAAPPAPAAPACPMHAQPALWCAACATLTCRACPEHVSHAQMLRPAADGLSQLMREVNLLLDDLQRLAVRRRHHLLGALDAVNVIKMHLQAELAATSPPFARLSLDAASLPLVAVAAERDRLLACHERVLRQCHIDQTIRNAKAPLDFDFPRLAPAELKESEPSPPADLMRNPELFLANYCMAQLYARSRPAERAAEPEVTPVSPLPRPAVAFPQFYFELEVNGVAFGRVVIEVRNDVAPRMARNFASLATGKLGFGYCGCSVFQCWENESVITGDFELNNGRGGHAALEEKYFMPDHTNIVSVRGAVGMRRSSRRRTKLGLVGSQFRIMLREITGFTAIFAYVVEGLELVDNLSRMGDSAGNPLNSILIAKCGKFN